MVKRVVAVILLVAGLLLAVAGGLAAATFGPSGSLQASSTPVETGPDGYALVVDVEGVDAGFPGSTLLGTTTLGADSTGTERLFVGIGSREDVNRYLNGVGFEAVQQSGSTWQSFAIPGSRKPTPPTEEDLWFRRATGNAPEVEFAASNGSASFVIMNDEGQPDVSARVVLGYQSRWIFPLAIATLVLGVLLMLTGIIQLRRRDDKTDTDQDAGTTGDAPVDSATPIAGDSAGQTGPGERS